MKTKNKVLILSIIGLIGISSYTMAQTTYVFRSPASGVNSSRILDDENNTIDEENDVGCYVPESIGKIGTEAPCSGMLIVNRNMLEQSGSSHYLVNGDESFAIEHIDSGRIFTYEDSDNNIFTGQVTNMNTLFYGTSFNGDIAYWDTSNVITMESMFRATEYFNQDISGWNMSNITDIGSMFYSALSFNQDIGEWDTSSVEYMSRLFWKAPAFNQDIGGWDTSNVTQIVSVFADATSFNQDLSDWCVSNINSSQIGYFDTNANSWTLPDSRPVWGTCPRGEDQL